jgi:hypothetical protein
MFSDMPKQSSTPQTAAMHPHHHTNSLQPPPVLMHPSASMQHPGHPHMQHMQQQMNSSSAVHDMHGGLLSDYQTL